jgi:hypothetical protein
MDMKITKLFALLVALALITGDVVAQCSIPAFGVPVKTGDYTAIAENNGKLLVSRKRRPIRRAFSGPTAVEKWLHSAILSDPRDSHSRNNKASVSFQFLGCFCCGNILGAEQAWPASLSMTN